jgi:hypothetical protein
MEGNKIRENVLYERYREKGRERLRAFPSYMREIERNVDLTVIDVED